MAILGSHLKVTIRGTFNNQKCEVVQWYQIGGGAFLTADAVSVGEAYWNDIKSAWRAMFANTAFLTTDSIVVSEPGDTGAFGEFSVPAGERAGTRDGAALAGLLPTFTAAAFRETVATRTTRPGQKRLWGLFEADMDNVMALSPAYRTLLDALVPKFTENITLGAPVATGVMIPEVVRLDRSTGAITASQLITGAVVNPLVTSQVSRKVGRGI